MVLSLVWWKVYTIASFLELTFQPADQLSLTFLLVYTVLQVRLILFMGYFVLLLAL